MNILVVNDDGYQAEGIKLLAESLKDYGKIFVMSPETQQSGASHCITLHTYVRIHERNNFGEDIKAWSIEGTPADCVIYALKYLKLDIDLVVSGINNGPNLGTDTIYSGTLAGATEALVQNIPAIAFSADFDNFAYVKKDIGMVVKMIFDNKLYSTDYVLNVNFPTKAYEEIQGVKVTEQGVRLFKHDFKEEDDRIWARGWWGDATNEPTTDVYAFENGYVSLCPMGISRAHFEGIKRVKKVLKIKD
jgi:5'-nucleotidase